MNSRFTNEISRINLDKEDDIKEFENETSLCRKIKYILENIENKEKSEKNRLEIVKKETGISDESFIKEILGKYYRKKYFGALKIESLNELNKEKIVHILERSEEEKAEIKRLREERKVAKAAKKERGKRKGVQTTIKFPKNSE